LFNAAKTRVAVSVVDPIDFSADVGSNNATLLKDNAYQSFDALIIRGLNFNGDSDFQFEILEQLSKSGTVIVNSPTAIQYAESKFLTSYILKENGFPIPESLVIQKPDEVPPFLKKFRDIIAKPIYGFQGHGVIRVKETEPDAVERVQMLIDEFRCICLQRYIVNPGRDIRAFVVGDRVVASIYRFARPGEWKTTIRTGGLPEPCSLTPEQYEIAVSASRCLSLDYTGVDIIEEFDRNYVLEVNGAPAWGGILEATGRNVADDIIAHVIDKLESRDS
jgi:tetrahydromethanopterin:alpha-L-glutamate ligase